MNQKKVQAWLLLFIILASLLTYASIPYTPAHSIYNEEWNGASEFRSGLETGFNYSISRLLVSPIILESTNNISVVVIIGSERKYSDAENQAYVQFVESGGSLIIFEDFGPSRAIAERFGFDFLSGTIKETFSAFYVNRPSQIFIFDLITPIFFPGTTISPMLGSDVVGVLDINGLIEETTIPLLVTNPTAFLDVNDNDIIDDEDIRFESGIPVGLFKRIGNGSITVIGDSSIPLNQYWEETVRIRNPETGAPAQVTLSNAFWSTMLVAFVAGLTNSTNITFDESHQAISVTSAAGILNLIAGTWVGLINSTAISLTILALSLVFTGINFRSRLKSKIFIRRKSLVSMIDDNGELISHPTLAERLISEQYILYQVMGENYIHVANTHLVQKLKDTGKADSFLKKIEEEYGQDLRSANTFEQLLDLHAKLQYFVEENKNRLL